MAGGDLLTGQQSATPLAEVVRHLPDYLHKTEVYVAAIENASHAERETTLADLMVWLKDERPKVRGFALVTVYLLSLPSEKQLGSGSFSSLPVQYVPTVAALLRDSDPMVRSKAIVALQSAFYSRVDMEELAKLVVPMLREPDVVVEYPDTSSVEMEQEMLAKMTPEQIVQYKAMSRPVRKLDAEGVGLMGMLAIANRPPSNSLDDAMIAFLDRDDLPKSSLQECLHTLALASASERVNDEALRRVFARRAMTAFLLQFVSSMPLTAAQLAEQRARLLELSHDESAHPALRRAAKAVAACWTGDRHAACKPDHEDINADVTSR